jgi:hypothetical protein
MQSASRTYQLAERLLRFQHDLPPEHFVVLDGAMHPGLSGKLPQFALSGRPLYLEGGDPVTIANGPYLVHLRDDREAARLAALIGDGREPVFWSWPSGEHELYRHLRRQNMVEIPLAMVEAEGEPSFETVLFRHWDPHVLGTTLPALTPEQMARFIGKAGAIAFHAPFAGGEQIIAGDRSFAPQLPNLLRLSPEQMGVIGNARQNASYVRIESYLLSVDAAFVETIPRGQLRDLIVAADQAGRTLGLHSERALAKWTYLYVSTLGSIGSEPTIAEAFRDSPQAPEDTLDAIYEAMAMAAERGS